MQLTNTDPEENIMNSTLNDGGTNINNISDELPLEVSNYSVYSYNATSASECWGHESQSSDDIIHILYDNSGKLLILVTEKIQYTNYRIDCSIPNSRIIAMSKLPNPEVTTSMLQDASMTTTTTPTIKIF